MDRTSDIVGALESVLGSDSVDLGSASDQGDPRLFVPSGVPELDLVLDREGRGWPVGRIIEIYGGPGVCKTGIGYALIAQCQKMDGTAILYPSEGNYDKWLASQYGVDNHRVVVPRQELDCVTVERVFASWRKAMRTVGRDGLLVGVIDSIAALSTVAEIEDETVTRDRAHQVRAQLISKALRKIGAKIPQTNSILFCINQVRSSGDEAGRAKAKPPGGMALGFFATIRLRLEMVEKVWRQRQGKRQVAGFKLKITAEKNRMAIPYQNATLLLDFEKGLIPIPEKRTKKV